MKKIALAFCASVVVFASCTEKNPVMDMTGQNTTVPNLVDTIYVSPTTITAEPRNILVEEFTGASCSNCPAGHIVLNGIVSSNPGRINVIGIHPTDFQQADPLPNSKYRFQTQASTDIENRVYMPLTFMPSAGIDRMPYNGNILSDRGSWPAAVSARLSAQPTTLVNLAVSSSYTTADSTAHVTVTVSYPKATTSDEKVTVVIVEDSLVDKQEDGTKVDTNYQFNNVLRGFVNKTTYTGDNVATTTKVAGTVNYKQYTQKITNLVAPKNCRVIAFVTNANTSVSKEVLQSAQCKLMGP